MKSPALPVMHIHLERTANMTPNNDMNTFSDFTASSKLPAHDLRACLSMHGCMLHGMIIWMEPIVTMGFLPVD